MRIGGAVVDAADRGAVIAAIRAANGRVRVEELDDALNPWLIEEGRALALLEALGRLPAGEIQRLGGRAVELGIGLPVMMTSPVGGGGFAGITGFDAVEGQGDRIVVRVTPVIDCGRAGRVAGAAQGALEREVLHVRLLETRRELAPGGEHAAVLRALAVARVRRFALATAWHENAAAAEACRPADRDAAIALSEAEAARGRYAVPFGAMN